VTTTRERRVQDPDNQTDINLIGGEEEELAVQEVEEVVQVEEVASPGADRFAELVEAKGEELVLGEEERSLLQGVLGQEPRSGREEGDLGAKKEPGQSNLLEPEKEKDEPEEVVGANSTSEGDTRLPDRKHSSKLVSSASFNKVSGAEKDIRGSVESQTRKGRRKRSGEQEDIQGGNRARDWRQHRLVEEGCNHGRSLALSTAMGETNLSVEYCLGCSTAQGHNCSYRVPLSAHLPDPSVFLVLPASAARCTAPPRPHTVCPAENDIAGGGEVVNVEGSTTPPTPSNFQAVEVEVRTHSHTHLTFRLPSPSTTALTDLCSLPPSKLGKTFTQIEIEVLRMCGE